MKILLINKFHYKKGGAEKSYFDMAELLADHGHDLAFFSTKHPDNLPSRWSEYFVDQVDFNGKTNLPKKIKAVINIFYNFQVNRNLEKLILKFKPDIAHLHSIYHQLSPSVIKVLKKYNIPIIMTLHDYKLVCPNYNLFAHGRIWEKSKPDKYYKAFFSKAVKNSYIKSLICALEAYLHKYLKLYEQIDLFISPSQFLIDKFKEFGFKGKIIKLPHFVNLQNSPVKNNSNQEKYILYFGRLSQEKGVDELINSYALLNTDLLLKIAGEGQELKNLQELAWQKGLKDKIIFTGRKGGQELASLISNAEFVVLPSKWYENYPYSVLEAMALKKIVICAKVGGISEIIENGVNGLYYSSGNIVELAKKMQYLLDNSDIRRKMEFNSFYHVKSNNDKEKFYNSLINIYNLVLTN